MIKILTNNWKAKIVCILIAVGFWTYVASNQAKVDNFPGGAQLELTNTPEGMVAITDVDKIDLKIVAERGIWNKLTSDNIHATVNLSNLSQGTHELSINVTTNTPGVQIVDYIPKTALIRLEPKATKNIPVTVKIEGDAAEGLMAGVSTIVPEQVEISGAKSVIDKILEATATIRLNGETADLTKNVKVEALNSENTAITGVSFNPETVKVTIPIIKAGTTKTVGIKVKTIGNLVSGFWISNLSTTPSTVTINGASSLIRSVNYIETKELNIDGLSSSIAKTIDLNIPAGISIIDQVSEVRVNLEISSVSSSKQISAQISPQNISPNIKINSLDPNTISVNLSGATADLDKANSDSIKLNLDFAKYDSPGIYSFDITNTMFSVPNGVTIISFVPSSIKVNLVNK